MTQHHIGAQQTSSAPNPNKKLRRNFYRWHKVTGLAVLIPLILWTASGLMHPMMAHWFKAQLSNDQIAAPNFNRTDFRLSPQQVMQQNKIVSCYNFRIIRMEDSCYYQVKTPDKSIRYFNTNSGRELSAGDMRYAHYLAGYFYGHEGTKIIHTELLKAFNFNYQYVNRLLPVYKVRFNDSQQTDIYVETFGSRLATYNDNNRRAFIWVFNNFHTWSFLENITNDGLRFGTMIFFLTVIIFAALSGMIVYILLWKKFRQAKNTKGILKKYHRQTGIFISVFMLMFAFSGAYHASTKLNPQNKNMVYQPIIKLFSLKQNPLNLPLDWERLANISVVVMKKDTLFQVSYHQNEDKEAETLYFSASTTQILPNGDIAYASWLSKKFAGGGSSSELQLPECCVRPDADTHQIIKIKQAQKLTRFTREYGFVNKRLPVVQVTLDNANRERYYIETTHSQLAARIDDSDLREGYAFAFLHKFFFMEWAGKGIRDFTMAVSALAVLIVSLLGLAIYIKK